VNLATQVGRPYDARDVERDVRYLWGLGRFDDIRVETEERQGGLAVVFRAAPAPHLLLHEIRIQPNPLGVEIRLPGLTPMSALRAHGIAMDAERQLRQQGFPDAKVRYALVPVGRGEVDLELTLDRGDFRREARRRAKGNVLDRGVCAPLFAARREAQRQGVLDFTATRDGEGRVTVERGASYRVGRIEFLGNHRYGDRAIRRNFLLQEGAVFDEQRLRRSIARLNRVAWFERIGQRDVLVHPDEKTGFASVTVRLNEPGSGSWRLSGPAGPLSFGGPVQASLRSRLPWWTTYTVSASLFVFGHPLLPIVNAPKGLIPVLAVERPYVSGDGWKSGFAIAPRLGWKNSAVSYAATQIQQRLLPLVSGERGAQASLDVGGEAPGVCQAPRSRLGLLRAAATLGLHFLGSLPALP